ncbi:S41 family peptidase [Aureispira anguillae]|uniref:S41 family peptidase n=1 Tax=Aureispira anguillae TaxID=2864201 RepID=A0A915YIQ4_9BACT|nr:S41 family peptidase [Aureispira anguillae]BDS13593.1 S41 family peptidase [Aureispira anguillae]
MEGHEPLSNKEKMNIFLPLILALALAGGTWLGFELAHNKNNSYVVVSEGGNYPAKSGKVEEILRFIDARYLENEASDKLEDAAINAVLEELDPHSTYISLDNIERVNESLNGNFEGIGIEFYILDDTIYVVGVIEDGPSDKAGLQKGDKIIMINDTMVAGKDIFNDDVVDQLKGSAGSSVSLKIKRAGEAALKTVSITRGQIPVSSVLAACMLNKNTGLIKINRFSGTTYLDFRNALEDLVNNQGLEHLILDLRHNPGGYLEAATRILDQLFTARKLLVYTEGRSYRRKEYNSTGKSNFDIGKVVVLIDENSASASEIIAGAIQDNDRGLVIGRRSFGKGLVQEQYKLTDGSALRLTVARYFTPSGRYIQKPYDGSDGLYGDDLRKRYESGELYHRDSIHVSDSSIYRTTNGRIVHGGGGIIPDIFIPLDTTRLNSYFQTASLLSRDYIYKYLDNKRLKIKAEYPSFKDFKAKFKLSDATFEQLINYTVSKKLDRNNQLLQKYEDALKLEVKAHLADQIYGEAGYYQTLFSADEMVLRAIQEIDRDGSISPNPAALVEKTTSTPE